MLARIAASNGYELVIVIGSDGVGLVGAVSARADSTGHQVVIPLHASAGAAEQTFSLSRALVKETRFHFDSIRGV